MLEGVHAYLASAACSRHGEGKAVHLEVRPHAEGGGYAQLHDVAVPASLPMSEALAVSWFPFGSAGHCSSGAREREEPESRASRKAAPPGSSGHRKIPDGWRSTSSGFMFWEEAGAFQKLEGSIPDGQQERGEAQVVDSQNAVHPDLHIFEGGEVHGEAEEALM